MNYTIGTGNTDVVNAWNDFSVSGESGYIKLATIKVLCEFVNYPLRFTINGRGFNKPINLVVLFKSAANKDPDIDKYTLDTALFNGYDYKFYIAKETDSTWSIYAKHPTWTSVAVTKAEIFCLSYGKLFDVTYPNVLVDELPEGNLEFVSE